MKKVPITSMRNVKEVNDHLKGRKIIISNGHLLEDEEVDFVEMVKSNGSIPVEDFSPNKSMKIRVQDEYGKIFDLKQKHIFVKPKHQD